MDASSILQRLLPDANLTSGQVVRLRAIDTNYWSEIYALKARGADDSASKNEMEALKARTLADVREILTDDQRRTLEQKLPLLEDTR